MKGKWALWQKGWKFVLRAIGSHRRCVSRGEVGSALAGRQKVK